MVQKTTLFVNNTFAYKRNVSRVKEGLKPHPYSMDCAYTSFKNMGSSTLSPIPAQNFALSTEQEYFPDRWRQDARRKAYDRLVDAVGSQASLGITIAQRQQSMDMISNRAIALYNGFRALGKGKFHAAEKYFGVQKRKNQPSKGNRARKHARDTAGRILETNYGWVPLITDIMDSCDVLSQGYGLKVVKGRGTSMWSTDRTNKSGSSVLSRYKTSGVIHVQYQTEFVVTNPNLRLAAQLGILNPAAIVWDAIPFSFLVDQFANVSQFLNQWSDFIGLTLINPMTTELWQDHHEQWRNWDLRPTFVNYLYQEVDIARMSRSQGILGPTLQVLPLQGPSVRRALNNISLLLTFLKSQPQRRISRFS